jgi:hypothetical protein
MSKEIIAETWTMHTPRGSFDFAYPMGSAPVVFKKPPVWMTSFKKVWDNPQDPVHFEFTITDEQYVQDAFNYLYNGPVQAIKYPVDEQPQVSEGEGRGE